MPQPIRSCLRLAAFLVFACGAMASQAQERFTASADGREVRDSTTQLSWRRCAEGMRWEVERCVGKPTRFTYAVAKKTAAGSGAGWRVPTREELLGLVDKAAKKPKIDGRAFPQTPALPFWSSRAGSDDDLGAWLVSFANGKVTGNIGQAKFPLRLVRSGA